MSTFSPDLIIEVTSACNRACVGCYAPNVVSQQSGAELYAKRPELFLSIESLKKGMESISGLIDLTAIRGGEPSLHPELASFLTIASEYSSVIMLETHARWLLPTNVNAHKNLVKVIRQLGVVIKISFDRMHGLSNEDLQKITQFLSWNEIDYRIAITESSALELTKTRNLCTWITDDQIIYQVKATNNSELISPNLGVINVAGRFLESVSSKLPPQAIEALEVIQ